MVELIRVLLEQGIGEVRVACTHGVFVHGGLEKIAAIPQVSSVVCTDTVFIPPEKRHPKLQILPVGAVFAEAIRRNFLRQSIGDLFIYGQEIEGDPE